MIIRKKIQLSTVFAANALIYVNDLYAAVLTAAELIMGVLL
jgi:hypothetical protein